MLMLLPAGGPTQHPALLTRGRNPPVLVTRSPVCPTSCTASALTRETRFILWFISKPRRGFLILLKNIFKKNISTHGSEPYFFYLYINNQFLKIRPSWAEKWRHWGSSAAMHCRGRIWLLGLLGSSDFPPTPCACQVKRVAGKQEAQLTFKMQITPLLSRLAGFNTVWCQIIDSPKSQCHFSARGEGRAVTTQNLCLGVNQQGVWDEAGGAQEIFS